MKNLILNEYQTYALDMVFKNQYLAPKYDVKFNFPTKIEDVVPFTEEHSFFAIQNIKGKYKVNINTDSISHLVEGSTTEAKKFSKKEEAFYQKELKNIYSNIAPHIKNNRKFGVVELTAKEHKFLSTLIDILGRPTTVYDIKA